MSRSFKSSSSTTQPPSGAGNRSVAVEAAAGTASIFSFGEASVPALLDTTSTASISGMLSDPVWGEPSFASLWDDSGSDTFDFRVDAAGDDEFSDLHAGDRLDLDWDAPDAGSTLTLVIGPTFTGAGQLIIHADGNQTYIESNPITFEAGEPGLGSITFNSSDGGGADY